jgi:uncharacterized delta-60 repeat protein
MTIERLEPRVLLSAGAVDTRFGGGFVTLASAYGEEFTPAHALAVQPDGKVLVGGISTTGEGGWVVARYDANGQLDSSFGDGGVFTSSPIPDEQNRTQIPFNSLNSIVVNASGDIFAAGTADFSDGSDKPVLLEISPSGRQLLLRIDNFVSGAGLTPFNQFTSLAVQSDGKIVAAGFATGLDLNGTLQSLRTSFLLVRYLPDGSLDPSFGDHGVVLSNVDTRADMFNAVAVQPDGKIVAAGFATTMWFDGAFFVPASGDAVVERYTASGGLDTSFGTKGVAKFDFPGAPASGCVDVKVAGDGRIVIAGLAESPVVDGDATQTAVARLTATGQLDPSFADAGALVKNDNGYVSGVAVQTDGKVLLTGFLAADVIRLRTDGSIDPAFQQQTVGNNFFGTDVAIGPGGNVIVAGAAQPGDLPLVLAAARYHGDTGSIRGVVFDDRDGNGKHFGSAEVGLAGRLVYIDSNGNGKLDPGEPVTATDAAGRYAFLGVDPAANILVRQVLPAGWRQTTPFYGGAQHVTVTAGVATNDVNFGATDHAFVSGHVLSATGQPLANIRVWIDDDGDGIFQTGEESVITDQFGYFAFTNLPAGTHEIADSLGHHTSITLGRGEAAVNIVLR